MAGHPKDRKRFTTNIALLERASTVALCPAPDRAVFYAEDEGLHWPRHLSQIIQGTNASMSFSSYLRKERPYGKN